MEHTGEWDIKLFLFHHDTYATVRVVLDTGTRTLEGIGHAGQFPDGRLMEPAIDTELAAGRALADLADQLKLIAAADTAALHTE